ncbi:MAG TPA: YtxH domain-containing protein [Pyrinomonadaceae bacterium]|nr:YtxH domain-containing protein [Pyrinomonadaceae bacterium]
MNKKIALIGGLGIGAALMYLLDPDRGRGRRELIREKAEGAANKAGEYAEKMSQDIRDRASEVVAEAKAIFKGVDNPSNLHAEEDDAPSSPGTSTPFGSGPATAGNPYPSLGEPHVL